jgi:histidine triad (HIT) family protein
MSVYDENNVFARILRGEIPCQKVFEDAHVLAFRDIHPQAAVHILVIPKGAYQSFADFSARARPEEITAFFQALGRIARQEGLESKGYRLIANTGEHALQEVPHFHFHLLGGEGLGRMMTPRAERQ